MRTNNSRVGMAWITTYIDEHLDERLSLKDLAAKAGLSVWRFCVVFRQHVGVSSRWYIKSQRLQKVKTLLVEGESAASAASIVGFYDHSHLCRHFKNAYGMTPGRYLKGRQVAHDAQEFSCMQGAV